MRTQTTPGTSLGGRGVDRGDPAVGDRTAQHLAVEHPRNQQVADELGFAPQLLARVPPRVRPADVRSRLGNGRGHACCELGDGLEDAPVAGAAAEIAGQSVLDLLLAAELALLEQRVDGQEHAGRAEAALQRGVTGESVLQPGELRPFGEAFDRRHVLSVGIRGQVAARADGKPVHEHRACAAHLHVARALGAGQPERVPEEIEQQLLRREVADDLAAVDATGELHRRLRRRARPDAARRPSTPRRTRRDT